MNRGALIAAALLVVAGVVYVLVGTDPSQDTGRTDTTEAVLPNVEETAMTLSENDWDAAQTAFLAENAKRAGWSATGNGIQYTVVKVVDGAGVKPAPGSEVTVHYEGRLIDGRVFDSSYAPQ